jgi:hypothetical protein
MSFSSKESAIKYAEVYVLNKPLANISNSNKVFGFQPVPYNPNPKFELVA